MLVLARMKEQRIMIGHDIIIQICDVRGDKVKIGIEAPRELEVHREEVYQAIQREKLDNPSDT